MHPAIFDSERVRDCFDRMQRQRILVVGDLMLDRFIWGQVTRISPEAPVPVVRVTRESAYPGGASNVARNLADFGLKVSVAGVVGADAAGGELLDLLNAGGIATSGVLRSEKEETIVKTRIIARQQQVVRVDREKSRSLSPALRERLGIRLREMIPSADAVIVEDYGKGVVTAALVRDVFALASAHRVPVAADPNAGNPIDWTGASVVKPNRQETFAAAVLPFSEDMEALLSAGQALLSKWAPANLLITLGEEGMLLLRPGHPPYHTPARAREVYDVSGAGDTAIAFFTAALVAGLDGPEAAEIANHAAGIVVGKLGTAIVKPDELRESLLHEP